MAEGGPKRRGSDSIPGAIRLREPNVTPVMLSLRCVPVIESLILDAEHRSPTAVAEPGLSWLLCAALNILIVKLSAIGDVIHTMPALVALRRQYPQAHISWVVEEAGASVLRGHPALDRLIVWPRRAFAADMKHGRWGRALGGFRTVLGQVRDREYDLILDFQALLKSGLWVWLARGRRKVGFGRGMEHAEGSYLFLNERVPPVSMEVHALDRGLILLEHAGVPRGPVDYQFPRDATAESEVADFLAAAGVAPDADLVVMHPIARWRTKLWKNDGFAAVADELHSQGVRVVLSGGREDAAVLDDIAARMQTPVLRFDGRGGLLHLAALCRRARAMVSTDTGPMHLAAAIGIPVIALFGPTAPNRTGPHGEQHVVIRSGVECSPCFKRHCQSTVVEEFGCMKRIEAGEVVQAVVNKLRHAVS